MGKEDETESSRSGRFYEDGMSIRVLLMSACGRTGYSLCPRPYVYSGGYWRGE